MVVVLVLDGLVDGFALGLAFAGLGVEEHFAIFVVVVCWVVVIVQVGGTGFFDILTWVGWSKSLGEIGTWW